MQSKRCLAGWVWGGMALTKLITTFQVALVTFFAGRPGLCGVTLRVTNEGAPAPEE